MNNICPFCNSEAETYEHSRSCKSCSDMLNLTVCWRGNHYGDYIVFFKDSKCSIIAAYICQRIFSKQELILHDGPILPTMSPNQIRLVISPNKVIEKLQTVLLLL